MKRIILLSLVPAMTLPLLFGCVVGVGSGFGLYYNVPSEKGLELYCWEADGEWFSGLLAGTNRIKFAEEIRRLQENRPCPLSTMKEILDTYTEQEKKSVRVIIVSSPATDEEIKKGVEPRMAERYYDVCRSVGLSESHLLIDSSYPSHSITYNDPKSLLFEPESHAKSAAPGQPVTIRVHIVCDADVVVYVNNTVLYSASWVGGYNEYTFVMPDIDVTVDISIAADVPNVIYLFYICDWLWEIMAEDVAEIAVESGYIGVAPETETDIVKTTDSEEIQRLLTAWREVILKPCNPYDISGGGFKKTQFVMKNGDIHEVYSPNGYYIFGHDAFTMTDFPAIAEDKITERTKGVTVN